MVRRPLRELASLSVLLIALSACRGGPAVHEERGSGHTTGVTAAANQPAARAERPAVPAIPSAGEIVSVVEPEREELDAELDLAIRVKNAYGYPAECLGPDAVREGLTSFSIRLSVTMTETGTVTRAYVSAPVTPEARDCLQARADRLRVAGPIPDAPLTVSTSIEVQTVARVAAAVPDVPAEFTLPSGARAPGSALPAVVGDGPAPGYVAPGHTLPAIAGDGPAAGSRPAGSALPARGSPGRDWMWISGSAEARGDVADNLDDVE